MNIYKSNTYITLLIAIILFSCGNKETAQAGESGIAKENLIEVPKSQFNSANMKLGMLSEQPVPTSISTRGYIDVPPGNKASISPYHGGFVKDIDILPGQKVKKGDLLFTLQNPEFIEMQQEYMEVKEQLEYLKIDYERQQTLAKENITSQKNLKKAESEYKVMLARHTGLTEQLKLINVSIKNLENGKIRNTMPVYSTLSGSITKVNPTKGAFVNASDVAVEITNVEHIHLELQVFEKDALMIEEGQVINFTVPESDGQRFTGAVYLVGKSVDGNDRTINVHGHIGEEDEDKFIPGMFVEAEIETDKSTGLCLPEEATVELDGEMYVLVKTGENEENIYFERIKVRTGKNAKGWVEILDLDLLKDKQVLVDGGFSLIGG